MTTADEIHVRAGRPEDADRIGLVLSQAFRDDPLISWVLRADERRDAARDAFFTGFADEELSLGRRTQVAERRGALQAAALWTEPPGAQPSPWVAGLRGVWGLRELTGWRRFPRFVRMVTATERHYPRFPHFYLAAIGSADEARGSGIGGALLRATLIECDATGMPAYLESSNPRNLGFYWRHGFRVLREIHLGPNAPSLTLMLREPFTAR